MDSDDDPYRDINPFETCEQREAREKIDQRYRDLKNIEDQLKNSLVGAKEKLGFEL